MNSLELSIREAEILRHITLGKNSTEIAQELFVSPHTVRTHRKNILRKLHVTSSVQAVTLFALGQIRITTGTQQVAT